MAILEFINGKNKTYSGLKKVIKYILRADKTRIGLYGGKNCDADNAYNDFILTKRSFSKETGRQYIHFVQSFSNFEKMDALKAKKVADELLNFSKFKEYQIVYATHTDENCEKRI